MSAIVDLLPTVLKGYLIGLLFISLIASWGSVFAYIKSAPRWYANAIGAHMVWFMISLATFLTFYVLRLFWPMMPGREILLVVLFTGLAAVLVWRFVLFIRLNVELSRERRRQEELDD